MSHNPYEPPRARTRPLNREPGPIGKAVLVGAIVDIGGTIIGGFIIGLVFAVVMGLQGQSPEQIQSALGDFDQWSPLGIVLSVVGTLMSGVGGYQCAVVANRTTYLAPGILSIVSTAFGAMMGGELALPQLLLMSGLTVAAILIGASLHIRKLAPAANPTNMNES